MIYNNWREWSAKNKGKYLLTLLNIQPNLKLLTNASNVYLSGNAMQMPDGPWYWVNYLLTALLLLLADNYKEVQDSFKELVVLFQRARGCRFLLIIRRWTRIRLLCMVGISG
jgi:hypothetical protein